MVELCAVFSLIYREKIKLGTTAGPQLLFYSEIGTPVLCFASSV